MRTFFRGAAQLPLLGRHRLRRLGLTSAADSGRVMLVVAALLAVAGLTVWALWFARDDATSAADEPGMHMTVTDPPDVCAGDTCTVALSQQFKLAVYIDKVPPDPDGAGPLGPGWVDAESYVDYDDTLDNTGALTYKVPGTGSASDIGGQINAAVACGGFQSGGQILPGESVNVSCITSGLPPVPSIYTGLFVSMDFNCSAADSVTVVELVSEDEYGAMSTGMVASDGTLQYPVSDTLTIVCSAAAEPSATPTRTSTPTHTVSALTATPKGPGPSMSLKVYRDTDNPKTQEVTCSGSGIGRTCQIVDGTGTVFGIEVVTNPSPGAFYGYQVSLQYHPSSTLPLQNQTGTSENVWVPSPYSAFCSESTPADTYRINCGVLGTTGNVVYNGRLVNVHFLCRGSPGQIDLIGGAVPGSSRYVVAGVGQVWLLGGTKPIVDSVNIQCVDPSPTPTNTSTPTATRTFTRTPTPTHTPTRTPTRTSTPTATRTSTATVTHTATATATATSTPTHTGTATATATRTATATATATSTPTHTGTATATSTSTSTPTATATSTPTRTATPTATATSTSTHTPTATATRTSTRTRTPTVTPTPTRTPFSEVLPTVVGPVPGRALGDVNCDGRINSIDAFFVLWFDASLFGFLPCPQNADVSADGLINSLDALFILQFHAYLLPSLPPPGFAGEGWLDLAGGWLSSLW